MSPGLTLPRSISVIAEVHKLRVPPKRALLLSHWKEEAPLHAACTVFQVGGTTAEPVISLLEDLGFIASEGIFLLQNDYRV